jgi:hypothetical protein
MGILKATLIFGIFSFCFLAKAQTAFYGGDFDGRGRFAGQVNGTTFIDFRIYDDFTVSAPTTVTGVFGNFLDSSSIHGAQLYWEIRSGVSEGNGGTMVVEGTYNTATVTSTGRSGFGLDEYHYESATTPFTLSAGTYFLTVAVDGGNGNSYLTTTSGTNGVGGPLANGNSYISSFAVFGYNFQPGSNQTGFSPTDWSMGIRGSIVPEPSTYIVLTSLSLLLFRRSKKSR